MKTLNSGNSHLLLWAFFLAAGLVAVGLTVVSHSLVLDLIEMVRFRFFELVSLASDPYNFV